VQEQLSLEWEDTLMQAIILAAGLARRMHPLSADCHKALLPVGPTTILGRIMEALDAVGVSRATVVTGYRAADVETFLRENHPYFDLKFVANDRYETTNNIISLALGLEAAVDDDLLLIECDLLFDTSVLQDLVAHPAPNVAAVDRWKTGMDGTVVTLRDGLVVGVHTTADQDEHFSYTDKFKTLNIYRFSAEFWRRTLLPIIRAYANAVDESSYYEVVLSMLSSLPRHRIAGLVVDGASWVEVDDPNDLAAAQFRFDPARRSEILDRTMGGHWNFDILDFSFIANSYFPTNAMVSAMRHSLPELMSCYGSSQDALDEKLGWFLGCQPGRVEVLHGAAQAFPILATLWQDKVVGFPAPTFGEYERVFERHVIYEDACGQDIETLDSAARRCDVLAVVNPNNPTGSILPSVELHEFAASHPALTLLVDESFLPFVEQPSLVQLLEASPLENVVVLASSSKALGIPGLRLGYIYTHSGEVLGGLRQRLPIWNLGSLTEYFLELLLKFRGDLRRSFELTRIDLENMKERLCELDVVDHVHDGAGTFLLTCLDERFAPDAGALRQVALRQHGIEIKDVTRRFADGKPRLRLAVRPSGDVDRLIVALEEGSRAEVRR